MRNRSRSSSLWLLLALVVTCVTGTRTVAQERVLHHFNASAGDGINPLAGLTLDAAGHFYGTTGGGGANGFGTVYELWPTAKTGWSERVLFNFQRASGISPFAGVILDGSGNLYGTTSGSGTSAKGVAFGLRHTPDGGWTQQVLHDYGNAGDAAYPRSGLISDAGGNLYGATSDGGVYGGGAVFELARAGNGRWKETVLHSFGGGRDGYAPVGALAFDAAGNLYGATLGTGTLRTAGSIYELTPVGDGTWTETLLHRFPKDQFPISGLVLDASGNLYGESSVPVHSVGSLGTVFELTPAAGGSWTETVLHTFSGGADGSYPRGGLVFDGAGNLYGTTEQGGGFGSLGGAGTVFQLSPAADGSWTEKILHRFGRGVDGVLPEGGLILDPAGNLYGTTFMGGAHGSGTVFQITP